MATFASSVDDISTNPKPRDRPESRWVISCALFTVPVRGELGFEIGGGGGEREITHVEIAGHAGLLPKR